MAKFFSRQSIRLPGFDYGQDGYYLITIGTKNREECLSRIENKQSILLEPGKVIQEEWFKTPDIRPEVSIDAFVIMPDHVHGIIRIGNPKLPLAGKSLRDFKFDWKGAEFKAPVRNLGSFMSGFKSICTVRIRKFKADFGWTRNYWERIIRSEEELKAYRHYIKDNPRRWEELRK